jgi:hypothetical protein
LLAALLGLCATACQRKTDASPTTQSLLGEWHWVATTGGFTGRQTYTPASTGTTETWVFNADSTYRHYTSRLGSPPVTETGAFSLGSVKSIHSGQAARALILRGPAGQTFVLEEVTTRLALSDNIYDGFSYTYER